MSTVKYCVFNNSTNSQECLYYCSANCFGGITLSLVFMIWFCYLCSLCCFKNTKRDIMYVTGLNNGNEEQLIGTDNNLVVVGRNIEKPPEYIE
mgnify:CR=1 FL=1